MGIIQQELHIPTTCFCLVSESCELLKWSKRLSKISGTLTLVVSIPASQFTLNLSLDFAIQINDIEMVEFLLENGEIENSFKLRFHPMHKATECGNKEIVRLLL